MRHTIHIFLIKLELYVTEHSGQVLVVDLNVSSLPESNWQLLCLNILAASTNTAANFYQWSSFDCELEIKNWIC